MFLQLLVKRARLYEEFVMSKKWYVVHAYSGFEKNVARALQERVELAGQNENFGEILVPTEDVVEMRAGQKRKSERKFFPGYVLSLIHI